MAERETKTVAWPRRIVRNTSVATRLSLVVVLVALVSLVITSIVGLQRGSDLADDLLRSRLTSIGAARADEVERYIGGLERATISQAISPSTAEAISGFADAFEQLNAETPSLDDEDAVGAYYVDVVAPELSAVRGRPVSAASLVPRAPAAVSLQANYVVPDGGDGGLLTDAGDGSLWSELHSSLHQSFDEFVIQTGVDDLYLIEPDDKTIVYSTAKDIDFGTSLLTGPQSGTALAVLINSFGDRTRSRRRCDPRLQQLRRSGRRTEPVHRQPRDGRRIARRVRRAPDRTRPDQRDHDQRRIMDGARRHRRNLCGGS